MDGITVLDPEEIKQRSESRKWYLSKSLNYYESVKSRDSRSGSGVLSPESSTAVHSLEYFLGASEAFRDRVKSVITGTSQYREQFLDMFSLFAGAAAGAAYVVKEGKKNEAKSIPGRSRLDFSKGADLALNRVMKDYLNGIGRSVNGADVLAYTNDLYDWIIKDAKEQCRDARLSQLLGQAESMHIQVDGIVINGFNYGTEKHSVTLGSVSREDYAGNEELLRTLEHMAIKLFDYDFKENKNPNINLGGFQQTCTVWGEPGMGKTEGIKIILGEAQEKAKRLFIPFQIKEFRGFKSEYYSKSSNNLSEIFEDVHKGDGIHVLVAEDIDTIFFARDGNKDRKEDTAIVGVLLNQLEGLTSNTKGNYLLLATSNHPLEGDDALSQRLRQCQIQVKGPQNPEEYKAVFMARLRNAIKSNIVNVRDLGEIGRLAYQNRFSNRDVRNICLSVLEGTENYDRPDNFYKMSFGEKVVHLGKNRKTVGDAELIGAVNNYAQSIVEQKKKENEAKVQRRLDDMKVDADVVRRFKAGA